MQKELQYEYLGNWENRDNTSNVEEEILETWLSKRDDQNLSKKKAIYEFTKAVSDQSKSLYDVNKEVYALLCYGLTVQPEIGQNKKTVWVIDWKNPLTNHFAIAEEVGSFLIH